MELPLLAKSLRDAPVIRRGDYEYFIHPLTDGIPLLDPDLLMESCMALMKCLELDADYILTVESMGIHVASVLSQLTGLPVKMVRKKRYGVDGEMVLGQETGYGKGLLYLNYVCRGDRLVLVDSVISTGGTFSAVLQALGDVGVEVVDAGCIIGRGDGKKRVLQETGVNVKTVLEIRVADGSVEILDNP